MKTSELKTGRTFAVAFEHGDDFMASRKDASADETSPSGICAITRPSSPARSIEIRRHSAPKATVVKLASTKSASSVAAQNTAAAGMPVTCSMRSARVLSRRPRPIAGCSPLWKSSRSRA